MTPISDKDLTWLRSLEDRLWEKHVSTVRANMSGHTWQRSYSTSKKARLSGMEWLKIVRLIAAHELPVTLGSANFCFGLCLNIYGHTSPPDSPEMITSVSGEHLPRYKYPRDRCGFEIGWTHFAPIAERPRNAELLEFYSMPAIRDKHHYDY